MQQLDSSSVQHHAAPAGMAIPPPRPGAGPSSLHGVQINAASFALPLVGEHEFDADFYRTTYPDLGGMDAATAAAHFEIHGQGEGREPCAGAIKETLIQRMSSGQPTLEIGPFDNPTVKGAHVRYADMFSTRQLQARALDHDRDPTTCPTIHYVLAERPLREIADRFKYVFSSHCIEHQPDLVQHLRDVSLLLDSGGEYLVVCPDMRYCFDHFLPPSSIADVVAAHLEGRTRHCGAAWINHVAMTTHNDTGRHWQGDHGAQAWERGGAEMVLEAMRAYRLAEQRGDYLDCHAWQFTPSNFRSVFGMLFATGLTDLQPAHVHGTLKDRNEFCAVLRKVDRAGVDAGRARQV